MVRGEEDSSEVREMCPGEFCKGSHGLPGIKEEL